MPTLDTARYPNASLQQCIVDMDLRMVGAGAAAPVMAASADNDNRCINTVTGVGRTSAGIYTIPLNLAGRRLMYAGITPTTPVSANYVMKACSYSSSTGVLTVTLISDAGAALDIVASDVVHLYLRWKNQGA